MQDLEIAKKRLREKSLTLVAVKSGKTLFETASHGISGFLEAIEKLGVRLKGASVADRIAGKAVALLCVYAEVAAVYAEILSEKGKEVLEKNAIYHEWRDLVETILDANRAGMCPFEKLATEISDPFEAYKMFKTLQNSLRRDR